MILGKILSFSFVLKLFLQHQLEAFSMTSEERCYKSYMQPLL